jgi:hypothetical protein
MGQQRRLDGHLPRYVMQVPLFAATDVPMRSRSFPERVGSAVTVTICDAGGASAPAMALDVLAAITTWERASAVRDEDGWSVVPASAFHLRLRREPKLRAYQRTKAHLDALHRLDVHIQGPTNEVKPQPRKPRHFRSIDEMEQATVRDNLRGRADGPGLLVSERHFDLPVGLLTGCELRPRATGSGYEFSWRVSPWLRWQIEHDLLGRAPLDVSTRLKSGLSKVLLVWVWTLPWLRSVKEDGGRRTGMERLWSLFPTAVDKPHPSRYRARLDAALREIAATGSIVGHDWEGGGWDAMLTIRLSEKQPATARPEEGW